MTLSKKQWGRVSHKTWQTKAMSHITC